ncbi:CCDC90 family protein [Gallibacterium salpingitidis]|uniref:DUF1640 domain-containing protein n=1 Tax=Gallibacterium salpingitidis TaxID=505341 RepID=UPI0026701C85|nr:DUF1640 domain-containing protein [Gallibacterium salpingitidis]WKS98630.1 CCDC90 family protein [Gallibacterium salpingitidis]
MKEIKILSLRSNETEHYLLLIDSFGKVGYSQELTLEIVKNLRNVIMDSQKDLVTRQEFQQAHQELKAEIQEVRTELKAEIQEVRAEIQEVKSEIKVVKSELKTEFYQAINRLTFAIIAAVIAITGALGSLMVYLSK